MWGQGTTDGAWRLFALAASEMEHASNRHRNYKITVGSTCSQASETTIAASAYKYCFKELEQPEIDVAPKPSKPKPENQGLEACSAFQA